MESRIDVDDVAAVFRYYGGLAGLLHPKIVQGAPDDVISRIDYEPVGVCGLIAPWNYPLLQVSWKIAPALLAGNTLVAKPSEITPLTTIKLFELLEEAGLPDGVANLVLGTGPEVGAPLSEHPDVDLVSFTGSLATGQRIMASAAKTVKKVALELGGKNPNIVFADADIDDRHRLRAHRRVLPRGPGLLVRHAAHRAHGHLRRLRERGRPPRATSSGWATVSTTTPSPARSSPPSTAPRSRATSRSPSRRARPSRPAASGPDEPELQNGFFFRPRSTRTATGT